jgi:hypothetical protein
MNKQVQKEIYNLHQSSRKHWEIKKIFKKIAETFNCFGRHPHHTQISVTTLFLKIATGEFDIIDIKTGKGFWNEKYKQKTNEKNYIK